MHSVRETWENTFALIDMVTAATTSAIVVMKTKNKNMEIVYIEAVLMDNREVIHMGKIIGKIGRRQLELINNGATKLTKGHEKIVAISKGKENLVA